MVIKYNIMLLVYESSVHEKNPATAWSYKERCI